MSTTKPAFHPYENEAELVQVGELMLENRLDRITISGDVDLTADKRGLAAARLLQDLVGLVVASLEARKDLPDRLPPPEVKTVDNPFS
jgi:hypothetical protein